MSIGRPVLQFEINLIRIDANERRTFLCLARAPRGEVVSQTVTLPAGVEDVRRVREVETSAPSRQEILGVGTRLSAMLFPGTIGQLLSASREFAQSKGALLRICVSLHDHNLVDWPWEWSRIGDNFVSLQDDISFTYSIESSVPLRPLAIEDSPLRILLVHSVEDEADSVGRKEVQIIRELVARTQGLELTELQNPSASSLQSAIQKGRFHGVHIISHGRVDEDGNGVLLMNSDQGTAVTYDGEQLWLLLASGDVRFVFINSCASAFGKGQGEGLATALIRRGLPAVIAIRYMITDDLATRIAEAFYQNLRESLSLDRAVIAARMMIALHEDARQSAAWPSLVLFARYRGERLIEEGNDAGVISATVNDGTFSAHVETLSIDAFQRRLTEVYSSRSELGMFAGTEDADMLLGEARSLAAMNRIREAFNTLGTASEKILDVRRKMRAEKEIRTIGNLVVLALVLYVAVAGLVLFLGVTYGDWGLETEIPILAIPISVVFWSLFGSVVGMLRRFNRSDLTEISDALRWLVTRPIQGMFMGCVLFLFVSAGFLAVVGQYPNMLAKEHSLHRAALIWAIVFLGAYNERLASGLLAGFSRRVSRAASLSEEPETRSGEVRAQKATRESGAASPSGVP